MSRLENDVYRVKDETTPFIKGELKLRSLYDVIHLNFFIRVGWLY